eukprot:CAMPEP_0198298726 /NCGR_PEP_ID=MMETSP1449-20131203/41919_1 /TAXON_ID=420275 /ORGANISM="Attheya septentrionalis, Strain CCMP2084" /LENGTH=313 /DNA_ID=CAMNT_0044000069 /DNA_START=119 /DNA_END=1057 /DNA_ORIENTATION=-
MSSSSSLPGSGSLLSTTNTKVIDSHLHVWGSMLKDSQQFPYPDGKEPPESLQEVASTEKLLEQMAAAKVDGALIVQPINYLYDHSYVANAIRSHPTKFKGMLLHDPTMTTKVPQEAVDRLEELALQGFVGVRFNPYLWPDGIQMSEPNGSGLAVYKRCAELHMPVGVMCFKGLELHYEDILALISSSPDTVLILDHLAFTGLDDRGDQTFQQCLLPLAKFPNVVIKISALFRVAGPGSDPYPYEGVRKRRFDPLLKAFGADRLMFGTDFPFVLEQENAYKGAVNIVQSWISSDKDKAMIMGGTAERLFGPWDS